MPDFLTPTEPTIIDPATPRSLASDVASPAIPVAAPSKDESKPEKPRKAPSRFWTDYYGVAFLILVAVFVAGAFLLFRPFILVIKETNANTEQALQTIDNERTYLASLDRSVAAANAIPSESLDAVSRALPGDANIPLLLVEFGAVAAQNNVKIGSITFAEAPPQRSVAIPGTTSTVAAAVIPIDVNLTVNARGYFDIKRFLADLEASLRLMDVVGISTSAAAGGASETAYQIQIRTYIFGIPKSAPKP